MKRALLVLAALAAACSNTGGAPSPAIGSFTASPSAIHRGESTTLAWDVTSASTLSIAPDLGDVSGSSTTVSPAQTTTYTLTATGPGGTVKAQATVTVTAPASKPTVSSFTASPATIVRGQSSTLAWSVANADAITIAPDVGTVKTSQISVSPTTTTTYTLTATNAVGQTQAQASITVRVPGLHLEYADPTTSVAGVKLVRNRGLSTDTHVVLDLVVGAPVSGFGVAMNLPFDVTRAVQATKNDTFVPGTAIDAAPSGTPLAAAKVPPSGPLQNVLVLGLARKTQYPPTDVALAAGAVLFSIGFDMVPNAPVGTVFDGVSPGAKFDAAVIAADGHRAVDRAGFAIGQLTVVNN